MRSPRSSAGSITAAAMAATAARPGYGHHGEHAVVGVVCHRTSMDVPPSGIHHREDGMAGECPREDA